MSGVLIVTGGGRGIGAATARLAAARGYAVCVNYLSNSESAERVASAIGDRKSTRLNSSHMSESRMPSSA